MGTQALDTVSGLNRSSPTPLYRQLEALIRREIEDAVRQPGDRLESVRELSLKHCVSPFTAHRTVAALARACYLRSERGSGMFVADTPGAVSKTERALNTLAFLPAYSMPTMRKSVFFSRLLHALFDAGAEARKDLLCLAPRHRDVRPHPRPPSDIDCSGFGGVVALSYDNTYLLRLHDLDVPVVVADYDMRDAGFDSVVFDNQDAGRQIAALLLNAGARRIAYVGFGRRETGGRHIIRDPAVWERHAGVKQALLERGCDPTLGRFLVMDSVLDSETRRTVDELLKGTPPDVVICFDDAMAVRMALELERRQIRPNRDIRLAGFGGTVAPDMAQRYLAANALPDEQAMARHCVRALLDRIAEPEAATQRWIIPMQIQDLERDNGVTPANASVPSEASDPRTDETEKSE